MTIIITVCVVVAAALMPILTDAKSETIVRPTRVTRECRYKVWYLEVCDPTEHVQVVHLILAEGGTNCEVAKHLSKACVPSKQNNRPVMPQKAAFKDLLLSSNHTREAILNALNSTDIKSLPEALRPENLNKSGADNVIMNELKDFEKQEDKFLKILEKELTTTEFNPENLEEDPFMTENPVDDDDDDDDDEITTEENIAKMLLDKFKDKSEKNHSIIPEFLDASSGSHKTTDQPDSLNETTQEPVDPDKLNVNIHPASLEPVDPFKQQILKRTELKELLTNQTHNSQISNKPSEKSETRSQLQQLLASKSRKNSEIREMSENSVIKNPRKSEMANEKTLENKSHSLDSIDSQFGSENQRKSETTSSPKVDLLDSLDSQFGSENQKISDITKNTEGTGSLIRRMSKPLISEPDEAKQSETMLKNHPRFMKNGNWKDGKWKDGQWKDGQWKDGQWKDPIKDRVEGPTMNTSEFKEALNITELLLKHKNNSTRVINWLIQNMPNGKQTIIVL